MIWFKNKDLFLKACLIAFASIRTDPAIASTVEEHLDACSVDDQKKIRDSIRSMCSVMAAEAQSTHPEQAASVIENIITGAPTWDTRFMSRLAIASARILLRSNPARAEKLILLAKPNLTPAEVPIIMLDQAYAAYFQSDYVRAAEIARQAKSLSPGNAQLAEAADKITTAAIGAGRPMPPASIGQTASVRQGCPQTINHIRPALVFSESVTSDLTTPISTLINRAGGVDAGINAITAQIGEFERTRATAGNNASNSYAASSGALDTRCKKPDGIYCTNNYVYHQLAESIFILKEIRSAFICQKNGQMNYNAYRAVSEQQPLRTGGSDSATPRQQPYTPPPRPIPPKSKCVTGPGGGSCGVR